MKLNFISITVREIRRRPSVAVVAFLILVSCGFTSTLAQKNSQKRVTAVQFGELAEGSRVSVFSDSTLDDYEAFRSGDRFYVRIPLADFAAAPPNFRGDGFDDVQVQRAGDSILLSFKLQLGASARVDQRSNRLDVIFSAPNKVARSGKANSPPSGTTANATPGIAVAQTARNQQKRNPDAAGPMPPDSPSANRPRIATQELNAERRAAPQTSQGSQVPRSSRQVPSNKIHDRTAANLSPIKPASPSRADELKPTPKFDSPSNLTPSSTPSHPTSPAVAQSTPLPPRQIVNSPSTASVGWKKRSELGLQWVSMNRVGASIGSIVLLGLLVFATSMLYRRRRKSIKTKRVKAPGVQPKYSPDDDLEESPASSNGEYDQIIYDDYVSDLREPEVILPSAGMYVSQAENGSRDWSEPVWEPAVTQSTAVPVNPWVPATPSIPEYAMKNEVPEREVFEL